MIKILIYYDTNINTFRDSHKLIIMIMIRLIK